MAVLIVAALLFAAVGFMLDRWWTLSLPLIVWPLYYLWADTSALGGPGLGDGWEYALAVLITVSLASIAAGIGARRAAGSTRGLDRRRS